MRGLLNENLSLPLSFRVVSTSSGAMFSSSSGVFCYKRDNHAVKSDSACALNSTCVEFAVASAVELVSLSIGTTSASSPASLLEETAGRTLNACVTVVSVPFKPVTVADI